MGKRLSLRAKLAIGAAAATIAVVAVAIGVWYFAVRSDPPPSVSLDAALEAVSLAAALQSMATPPAGANAVGDLAGTWRVVQGDTSFAGYRVDETLARFGANTAVGRTSALEGSLEFDGDAITGVEITADLTGLTSDQAVRDEQLQTQALETATYPTASFALTSSIPIDAIPAEGEPVSRTVAGELTLHGVTRPIQVDVAGALQSGRLVVVGSTEIQFADFEIQQPVSFSVLSTEDHGTLEFQLVFAKA